VPFTVTLESPLRLNKSNLHCCRYVTAAYAAAAVQAGVPSTGASCDAQRGIPAFVPFRILTLRRGSVNLCNRPGAVGCPADARTPYQDAFATSYFKMSKMYAVRGVNQGAEYGVQTQPCQVKCRV
jgi:hypothetical protein